VIHFRAWNGRKLRAQAKNDGHFTVSIGLELRWRRSPYIKYRNEDGEFWVARIDGREFLHFPAKGEITVLRSDQICYVGWNEFSSANRWISKWSPDEEVFEHQALGSGKAQFLWIA
jgi:hypothetical protein